MQEQFLKNVKKSRSQKISATKESAASHQKNRKTPTKKACFSLFAACCPPLRDKQKNIPRLRFERTDKSRRSGHTFFGCAFWSCFFAGAR